MFPLKHTRQNYSYTEYGFVKKKTISTTPLELYFACIKAKSCTDMSFSQTMKSPIYFILFYSILIRCGYKVSYA